MRSIPEALLLIAKSMVHAGVRVSDANRYLRREVETKGGEVTWTYQDVYHATGASTAERALDATNLTEMLQRREQEQGLFYRTTMDGEGCLQNVFFEMQGAHEIYNHLS
jgi:CTP-dependent riboflavin kinase